MNTRLIPLMVRPLPWLLGAWLVGCSGDDAGEPSQPAGSAIGNCTENPGADDPRAEEYLPGMAKLTDGGLEIALVESEPTPPARDDNSWEISIKDADGEPVLGATIEVYPYMPDHGHPTQRKAIITELDEGHYLAEPVTLQMPGFWTIDISASVMDEDAGSVRFAFCVL